MLFVFLFGDVKATYPKQLTPAKDNKRAGNLIYKDPKSKYEKFIERFVRRNKRQASRKSVVRSAQEKWKELRKDSAAVETYIAAKYIFPLTYSGFKALFLILNICYEHNILV